MPKKTAITGRRFPYGWGEDHRFWGMPFGAPETRSYPIPLNNISITSGTATVRVRLKGRTNDGQRSPDHHTRIYLNDVMIDDQLWEGQTIYDHIASIPQTLLQEGTNTVQVASVGDTGAVVDQILVNWIEIGYLDTYVAEDNMLLFNAPTPGAFQFEIKNFASNNAVAFDITDAENVIRIKNAATYKEKGAYTLAFKDTAETQTRYLALTPSQYKNRRALRPTCRRRGSPRQTAPTTSLLPIMIFMQGLKNWRGIKGAKGCGWLP